jgi:hypothetical protein
VQARPWVPVIEGEGSPMSRLVLFSLVSILGCIPPQGAMPAAPAATASFAGTYVGNGATVVLDDQSGRITGTATVGALQAQIAGVVENGQLVATYRVASGAAGQLVAIASPEGLELAIDGGQPIWLARGAAPAGTPMPPTGAQPTSAPVADNPQIPAIAGHPASGQAVRADLEGWELRTPTAWTHGNKDGSDFFLSKTEAGLVLVRYYERVTFEQAVAAVEQQIRNLGATPLGTRTDSVTAGRAVVAELEGTVDGAAARGRVVGIAGPSGMLVIAGIVTPDKLPRMRATVDALAMSARFYPPQRGPVNQVAGCFRYSSGGTAVWVERTLQFDGTGRFTSSGFTSAQSTDNLGRATGTSALAESGGNGGTYSVAGTTVTLVWGNGGTASFELVWEHGAVGALRKGNTWYLKC